MLKFLELEPRAPFGGAHEKEQAPPLFFYSFELGVRGCYCLWLTHLVGPG